MDKDEHLFAYAIIVAAGRGTRMNMEINKQYIELCGKPLLARTLEVFENSRMIRKIVLVVNENDIPYCRENIVEKFKFSKVKALIAGGSERQKSVYNGLLKVGSECSTVIIHDGARPFVTEEMIRHSLEAASEFGASCAAVPVKDTIKVVDDKGVIQETPERSLLWAVQTPQTFRYDLIMEAHERAEKEGFTGTDDTVLVERLGGKVRVVMGSYSNIKITTREDLIMAEAIAGERK